MKKKRRMQKIGFKFLIPVIGIMTLLVTSLGLFAYNSQKQLIENTMEETTFVAIDQAKTTISQRQESVDTLTNALNTYLIKITQGVAQSLKGLEGEVLIKESKRLTQELNISEIHIVDENGVIVAGADESFFGFDFNTSEQTRPFLPGIHDKSFAMAQDAQIRGIDGKLFQYVTVSRVGALGLVQIGVIPTELQELTDKVNINQISKELQVGKEGYLIIADHEGKIISHRDENEIGKDLSEYPWANNIKQEQGNFLYKSPEREYFIGFQKTQDHLIIGLLPTLEYYQTLNTLKYVFLFTVMMSIIVSSCLIYFISYFLIIKRIKEVLFKVQQIGEGNLFITLDEKKQDELGHLNQGLNKMVLNLRDMVSKINQKASYLEEMTSAVATASDETLLTSSEIAQSINEIAKGSTDQAQEIQTSVEQLSLVTKNIGQVSNHSQILSENVLIIEEKNHSSLDNIQQLKAYFKQNKIATTSANERISLLNERSKEIATITASITSISEQTNLLALNASIEAARAGEAGRGFAVVADQVRLLAHESAEAAVHIGEMIAQMKEDIEKTVHAIGSATQTVDQSDVKLEDTIETFYTLTASNNTLKDLSIQLKEICAELNQNTSETVSSVHTIAAVAEETAATSEEISAATTQQNVTFTHIASSTNQIEEIAKELLEMIKHFKTEEN